MLSAAEILLFSRLWYIRDRKITGLNGSESIFFNLGGLVVNDKPISEMTLDDAISFFKDNVGAVIVADGKADTYRSVLITGVFKDLLSENGKYHELIEKLWYHFNKTSESITEDYQVFIPISGVFSGKYARKVTLSINNVPCVVQINIYPLKEKDMYLFVLDELDDSQSVDETLTTQKVKSFQNTYLFSMYIDVLKDTIHSISVTEISDEVLHQELKYTDWRNMIVNMINDEYKNQFLEWSDPEYLKANFAPEKTASFDCLMKNLEGVEIWVKLIFSRVETSNPEDYRFIYMVQNIHDTAVDLRNTLKRYANLALTDTLTSIFNHGRMETEITNAIKGFAEDHKPVAIMIMDIDFFKHVNDNYGHAVGDTTLIHFSKMLSEYFENNNGVVGRWGGEEFVAVCYDADRTRAVEIAEEIRSKVAAETFDTVGNITCSIGVSTINANDDFEKSYRRMDNALYEAKSSGRNCVRLA